jgi:hypothetical protein
MDIERRRETIKVMRRSSPTIVVVLICFFFALPIYVASSGPAIWLRDHGIVSQKALIRILI